MPTVPLQANDNYKDALATMARDRKVTMALLVRRALDAMYGDDLKPYISFFESRGDRNHQTVRGITDGDA